MKWFVYILESLKDHKLYIGWTPNMENRLEEHNLGNVISTKSRRPLKLIFYEVFTNKKDSLKREKYFKSGWGRIHIKSMLKQTLGQNELI